MAFDAVHTIVFPSPNKLLATILEIALRDDFSTRRLAKFQKLRATDELGIEK